MALEEAKQCNPEVAIFFTFYKNYIHDYVSFIVCFVGSVGNIISIIVLTRKKMVSPTNIVLTGLVVADVALLLSYILLTCYQFLSHAPSYGWLWFKLFLMHFTQIYRTISIWMTIMLAAWRYFAVVRPSGFQNWCNIKTTYRGVVAGYILCPLLCVPLFISGNVEPQNQSANKTITAEPPIYVIRYTNRKILNVTFPKEIRYYIFSVVLKLVPSIVLTILSLRLVYTLLKVRNLGPKLTPSSNGGNSSLYREGSSLNRRNSDSSHRRLDREEQTNSTTRMLLALLFLFLLAEVPDGILSLLMIIHGTKVYARCCYDVYNISEVLVLLKTIDAAINFPVFYFLGCQFRTICQALFNCNTRTFRAPTDLLSRNATWNSKGLEDLCYKFELQQLPNQCTTSSLLYPKEWTQASPTVGHSGNPSHSSS